MLYKNEFQVNAAPCFCASQLYTLDEDNYLWLTYFITKTFVFLSFLITSFRFSFCFVVSIYFPRSILFTRTIHFGNLKIEIEMAKVHFHMSRWWKMRKNNCFFKIFKTNNFTKSSIDQIPLAHVSVEHGFWNDQQNNCLFIPFEKQ